MSNVIKFGHNFQDDRPGHCKLRGLITKPSEKLVKIDSFPNANFSGMYGHEVMDDPVCVKSRTGCMIMVANCPIMWQSKLQTEIAPKLLP